MVNKHMGFSALVDEQASPEVTINNGLDRIAAGLNHFLAVDLTSGNATVSDDNYGGHVLFQCSGHSVARDLTVPLEIDAGTDSPRLFAVENQGTGAVTVKGATGTTVIVLPGTRTFVYSDGINLTLAANNAAAIGMDFAGIPTSSQILAKIMVTEYLTFFADFRGASGHIGTNPTAQLDIDVQRNGSSIGTISISTGGVFTFVTASNLEQAVTPGQRITFHGPASPDATGSDISITLRGKKT